MGEDGLVSELVGRRWGGIFRESMAEVWRIARAGLCNDRSAHHSTSTASSTRCDAARVVARSRPAAMDAGDAMVSAPALDRLAGDDPQMQRLIRQAKRLVNKSVDILLHGRNRNQQGSRGQGAA